MSRKADSQTRENIKEKRKRRRIYRVRQFFRLILLILLLGAIGWASYHAYLWGSAVYEVLRADYDAYTRRHEQLKLPSDDRSEAYMNLLVLGVDNGIGGNNRQADTLILLSIDNLRVLSIPRGTLVGVNREKGAVPIAEIYGEGGVKETVKTVRDLLGISIQYYAVVNMKAIDLAEILRQTSQSLFQVFYNLMHGIYTIGQKFLATYLTNVVLVVVYLGITAMYIEYHVAGCGINQIRQGYLRNKFCGSEQAQKDVLNHVFCLCSSTQTRTGKGQQLVTMSNVII